MLHPFPILICPGIMISPSLWVWNAVTKQNVIAAILKTEKPGSNFLASVALYEWPVADGAETQNKQWCLGYL